ncbi:MAG: thermonuclease family protein [Nitrospirota bacterium]|nr:thermonuclease family protein [Nitrospirota bacterium]
MKEIKKHDPVFYLRHYFLYLGFFFSFFIFSTQVVFNTQVYAEAPVKLDVFESVVIKVIDGDTVRLKDGTLLVYLGIDAPELKRKVDNVWVYDPEPYAEEAAKFNKAMVEGKKVIVEIDPVKKHDRFGRLMAYVYVDKVLAAEELLRNGLAKADSPSLLMKHRIRFWSLEEMAWTGKKGLWADENPSP